MKTYVLRRLFQLLPILLAITFLSFGMMRIAGSDVVEQKMENTGSDISQEVVDAAREELGLDKPFLTQYVVWLGGILRGDMGTSYFQKKPVITLILQAFHYTVIMATAAYIVALIVGLTTGILAAVYHDRPLDRILMSLSALGLSATSFWVAIILQIYVGLRFDIFPVSGVKSPIGYVLPSAALGVRYAASIARITRASMLEVTGQDFVKTAYAKGLYSWRIILIHIFQNALVPIITVIGTDIGALLTGSMITENVFNIPGIGKLLIDAIHRRDIPLVQGGVIYVAAICVLIYFIVDILYAVINPNIRLTKGE